MVIFHSKYVIITIAETLPAKLYVHSAFKLLNYVIFILIIILRALDPCSENRYLLFLTENYAALDIMKHYLHVGVDVVDDQDLTLQPYILFGSSFPKDKEYTQVCPILKGA